MRRFHLAAVFFLLSSGAQAADITVYSPNIVNGPLTKLADAWTAQTGNKVTFAGFNVGRIRTALGLGRLPLWNALPFLAGGRQAVFTVSLPAEDSSR